MGEPADERPALAGSPDQPGPAPLVADRRTRALALRVGAIGLVTSLALVGVRLLTLPDPIASTTECDQAYVKHYDPARSRVDVLINVGDSQAWAALGLDPTYSDPEQFCDGSQELAYRASRPLFGWFVWAGSLGQPGLVPLSLFVMTALGIGVLGAASVLLASEYGRDPKLGGLTLVLPGTLWCAMVPGPEPLGLGLAMLGILAWRRQRMLPAVILLTAATLVRELLLVVPVVLAIQDIVVSKRRWRDELALAAPIAVYGAWFTALAVRYRTNPLHGTSPGGWSNSSLPFQGMVQALSSGEPVVVISFVMIVVLLVLALRADAWCELTWMAVGLAAMSTVFGRGPWQLEIFRVLLPLYAFALIAALPRVDGRRSARPAPATE